MGKNAIQNSKIGAKRSKIAYQNGFFVPGSRKLLLRSVI